MPSIVPHAQSSLVEEDRRMQALLDLELLDTPPEEQFDELVQLATQLCSTPISAINLIDRDRQWSKAAAGIPILSSPRDESFCTHVVDRATTLIVEDTTLDDRFVSNSFVIGEPHVRFYAGVPLTGGNGCAIGAFCVVDTIPRILTKAQRYALEIIARQVQIRLDYRAKNKALERLLDEHAKLFKRLSHRTVMLENFINSISSVLIYVTEDGLIKQWNAAAESCFGLSLKDVHGKLFNRCGIKWLGEESDLINLLRCEEYETRAEFSFEKNNESRWLGVSVRRVELSSPDEEAGLLINASDITERLALEKRLRQTHKMEAVGQLAAGIAHEINTPAQYVSDNLSFLTDSWHGLLRVVAAGQNVVRDVAGVDTHRKTVERYREEEGAADLAYVLTEVPAALTQTSEGMRRITHIVQAMKELSHPGSERKGLLNLNRALENAITITSGEWKVCAQVERVFDPSLPAILCFAGEIEQVFLNLLVNAAHAIAEKQLLVAEGFRGRISVLTCFTAETVEVRISDNGPGIPETIQTRVFEPFFTTKEVGKGTGQGLAYAHQAIVRMHEGEFWFESRAGDGTTFIIRLPRTPTDLPRSSMA